MEQSGTKSILIVDDERDILTVIEQMLEELNMTVDSFTDPKKALESFRINPTKYDLIISDFRMPQMSGLDFIYNIRQLNPTVNVVVMSAFDPTKGEIDSAKSQLRVSEIITKPFNFAQFLNVVRRNLGP
ncbi:response regulator [Nitrososphaera viennensis]|uniref:Response regulator n=2 Tax=Nitrososphaera viennensis TaxID=1034015 RepID=A0A977NMJ6_9ARCH|nr:response regulator [Nitrososphaera viennensis]UVS69888.1 response regulator [Nitrososphaera viennensis]